MNSFFKVGFIPSPIILTSSISTILDGVEIIDLQIGGLLTIFLFKAILLIFFINSGVVPQQPPITETPKSTNSST